MTRSGCASKHQCSMHIIRTPANRPQANAIPNPAAFPPMDEIPSQWNRANQEAVVLPRSDIDGVHATTTLRTRSPADVRDISISLPPPISLLPPAAAANVSTALARNSSLEFIDALWQPSISAAPQPALASVATASFGGALPAIASIAPPVVATPAFGSTTSVHQQSDSPAFATQPVTAPAAEFDERMPSPVAMDNFVTSTSPQATLLYE